MPIIPRVRRRRDKLTVAPRRYKRNGDLTTASYLVRVRAPRIRHVTLGGDDQPDGLLVRRSERKASRSCKTASPNGIVNDARPEEASEGPRQ